MDINDLLLLDFGAFNLHDENLNEQIEQYINALEDHRRLFQEQERYLDAQRVYDKLNSLKKYNEKRLKELKSSKYAADMQAIDDGCAEELQTFNASWDHAMGEYDHKTNELVEAMKSRHAQEFAHYQAELREKQPLRPKFSSELLNLRRVQQALAKQCNYTEAHRTQQKADMLEASEMGALTSAWETKLERQENIFKGKQEAELLALVKRIQTGQKEQDKARKTELDRVLQRYSNLKAELNAQQVCVFPGRNIVPSLNLSSHAPEKLNRSARK